MFANNNQTKSGQKISNWIIVGLIVLTVCLLIALGYGPLTYRSKSGYPFSLYLWSIVSLLLMVFNYVIYKYANVYQKVIIILCFFVNIVMGLIVLEFYLQNL